MGSSLAGKAWELIQNLPTNKQIFRRIVRLEGIRDVDSTEERDWENLFDTHSSYK